MTIMEDVQAAMLEAEKQVPASLQTLKRHYGLTNAEIAAGMGAKDAWVQERVSGATRCLGVDLRGFARFFGVDVDCLFMGREELLRWVLDHGRRQTPGCVTADELDKTDSLIAA